MAADHDHPHRLYFAYDSNLSSARLAAPSLIGTAILDACTLNFNERGRDGSGNCTIAPAAGRVYGSVYALHTDDIEGLGAGDDEREVWVAGHGLASTYVAAPDAIDDALPPFAWSLALVRAGAGSHCFPAAWLTRLDRVQAVRDPDAARASLNACPRDSFSAYPPDGCISTPHAAP